MNRYSDLSLQNEKFEIVRGYQNEKLVALEEALAPMCSRINGLSQYIKLALNECHRSSKHGLTRDESAAVYLYTLEWGDQSLYRVLNQALRSDDPDKVKEWFPFLKLFNSAISKLPTVSECVWRGVPDDISRNLKKDQIVTWSSINSCSTSIDVIKDFLSSKSRSWKDIFTRKHSKLVMIEIYNGKSLTGYTRFPGENEVVLAPGTKLRVVSDALHHDGGLHVIHLKEIYSPTIVQTKSSWSNSLNARLPLIITITGLLILCRLFYNSPWDFVRFF
jgi:hypothetical protein